MSGISSLGLKSALRYFMQGKKVLSQVLLVAPSRVVIPTAPCCTKKLLCKKYMLLEKTCSQKAHSRFLYTNYECTTAVPLLLLLYGLYVLRTILRYERTPVVPLLLYVYVPL